MHPIKKIKNRRNPLPLSGCQVPTGPLAADDDFQALHGAVRLLAREQALLRKQVHDVESLLVVLIRET